MLTVVLDHPQDLVNIAHVVRSMKNFVVPDLRLVQPLDYDAWRIEGIAHRTADLLERVELFDALEPALADCVHVVAFTARGRTARRNVQRPRAMAAEALERGAEGRVALLFGREDKGLSNEALDLAHRVCVIPSDESYPSLNLGHAVAIALYEVALARGADDRPTKAPRRESAPAEVETLSMLHADAEQALEAIGFFKTRNQDLIMRTLRGILQRTPMDQREAKLLRAMAIEVRKRMEKTRD